jgi:hypothetical protein
MHGVCNVTFPEAGVLRKPHDVATEIITAFGRGERVLLGNGPWQIGSTLGDPYIGLALSLLPAGLPPGVLVGGFHHAHALTELTIREPSVKAYVAPPAAETLSASDGACLALAAFATMDLLGTKGELLLRHTRYSHVGYSRPASHGQRILPDCLEIRPRTLRHGKACGLIIAGSLLPLSLALGRWPSSLLRDAILAIEIAGAQLRMIDRFLQRLALLGIFDLIGALLIGVPFDLVPETPSLELDEIVDRAVGNSSCVAVLDAFVGSGLPCMFLRAAAPAAVHATATSFALDSIKDRMRLTPPPEVSL